MAEERRQSWVRDRKLMDGPYIYKDLPRGPPNPMHSPDAFLHDD